MFFDNNCSILRHLLALKPEEVTPGHKVLRAMKFPVDVFHFKSKHKESDEFCGQHCNPAQWPELRTEDGKWTFNSSVAEQTNVWFGGFLAMVRELRVERYNFLLDEVIRRRNAAVIDELVLKGHSAWEIDRDVLLKPDN
jgi:hypothetical protein